MNALQRNFLLLVTLAAAAATPVLGQAAAPSAAIPNLSGWWIHPSIPGFEPLASGPTSLTNRSRRDGMNNILQLVGDYTNPILKPEAAAVVKKLGEMSIAHYGFHNPRNQCWPNGVPFILSLGVQLLQQPDKITMLYQVDHQVRHVRMNARHPAQVTPSWYGDSVGRYEGDTLVIDTVGIKVGPFAMVDWYGRRKPRLCTSSSDIGWLITKSRKRDWNGTEKRISAPSRGIWTPITGASTCSSCSRSRTRMCSPRHGRRR